MNKNEFIFPGVILGVVAIIAIGLIITHSQGPTVSNTDIASSTATSTDTVGAETPSTPSSGISQNYYPYGALTLSLNEAAGFKDGLGIRPLAVTQDSRCPADVQCIQAGTVEVSLKLDMDGKDDVMTIVLGKSITAGGDTITLTSVEPVRAKDAPPTQDAYRLTFTVEPTSTASVNASGSDAASTTALCYVGGCSREVCSDKSNAISTCIYRSEYACYHDATCERQADGACGWTETAELKKCLANPATM